MGYISRVTVYRHPAGVTQCSTPGAGWSSRRPVAAKICAAVAEVTGPNPATSPGRSDNPSNVCKGMVRLTAPASAGTAGPGGPASTGPTGSVDSPPAAPASAECPASAAIAGTTPSAATLLAAAARSSVRPAIDTGAKETGSCAAAAMG